MKYTIDDSRHKYLFSASIVVSIAAIFVIALVTDFERYRLDRLAGQERQKEAEKDRFEDESLLETIIHDRHWFVVNRRNPTHIMHHPNCPCMENNNVQSD